MRIITGTLKGRKINPPTQMPARPTTDRAKEGLFNILNNWIDFEDISALELFGGTGNISLELISRGAGTVNVVEKDVKLCQFMNTLKAQLQLDKLSITNADAFRYIQMLAVKGAKFDLIFADPPYALPNFKELPELIFTNNLLDEDGILVLEHDDKNDFSKLPFFEESRNYGTTIFSFFKK